MFLENLIADPVILYETPSLCKTPSIKTKANLGALIIAASSLESNNKKGPGEGLSTLTVHLI